MMFKGKSIFNASFDVYAENYHSVRPGYPAPLFDDIKEVCAVDKDSYLLEIGAGSGIATVELEKFGCNIVAIEPGSQLAGIAREQTKTSKKIEVFEGTFENFRPDRKFNAVLAFTAFHWLGEGDRYSHVLDMLDRSGSLVLVWNSFFQSDSYAVREVNKAYRTYLPDVYPDESSVADVNEKVLSKLNGREQEVMASRSFDAVYLRKFITTYNYNEQTYAKLLNTYPKIVELEDRRREEFLSTVSSIVKRHGKLSVPVLTTLIICRRRDGFLEMVAKNGGG